MCFYWKRFRCVQTAVCMRVCGVRLLLWKWIFCENESIFTDTQLTMMCNYFCKCGQVLVKSERRRIVLETQNTLQPDRCISLFMRYYALVWITNHSTDQTRQFDVSTEHFQCKLVDTSVFENLDVLQIHIYWQWELHSLIWKGIGWSSLNYAFKTD